MSELNALFVKAPEGRYPPIAITHHVTPTQGATHRFIAWLNDTDHTFDSDTETAFIPKDDMAGIFSKLQYDMETNPFLFDGFRNSIEALIEEVDTFEEPLDTYITAC